MDYLKKMRHNPLLVYLFVIILALFSGFSGIHILQSVGLLISDIFVRIFRCISMPIIALSIIVTLASYENNGKMKRVWRKALLYTISTTMIAATVSCLLYLVIQPSNVNISANAAPLVGMQMSYIQHLSSLIPVNFFAPFIDNQVISVLLIGLMVGIAIRFIPEKEAKITVIHFFKGLHGLFFVITKWIVAILPIGLYGFVTSTIVQMKNGINITGIGEYLMVVVLANLIQGFIILPIWLKINKLKPFTVMKKMLPALTVAFFSKSSAGTLPVTINTAEKNLNLNPKISRFILPLCTSINMNGCAAFIFATVIFLMQNHGVVITSSVMFIWIIVATIAAIGNAGVPMGCFFLSASLLSGMGVPIVLMGIILPFYTVIDMIETALNVWSDSCVATVIDKNYGLDPIEQPTVDLLPQN